MCGLRETGAWRDITKAHRSSCMALFCSCLCFPCPLFSPRTHHWYVTKVHFQYTYRQDTPLSRCYATELIDTPANCKSVLFIYLEFWSWSLITNHRTRYNEKFLRSKDLPVPSWVDSTRCAYQKCDSVLLQPTYRPSQCVCRSIVLLLCVCRPSSEKLAKALEIALDGGKE